MSDSRLAELKRTIVYAIYDGDDLLYVGRTLDPPRRREQYHRSRIGKEDTPLYRRLEDAEDFDLSEIDFETEREAIDALDPPYNSQAGMGDMEYNRHEWTPGELDLLGEIPDAELAERIGVSVDVVRNARWKLGIESSHPHSQHKQVDWEDWDHLLGTVPDSELAERIGCVTSNVLRRRNQLGIDPACPSSSGRERALSDEEAREVLLRYETEDTSYAELGDEYDVSVSTIGKVIRGGRGYEHIDRLGEQLEEFQRGLALAYAISGHPIEWIVRKLYATKMAVAKVLASHFDRTPAQIAAGRIDG